MTGHSGLPAFAARAWALPAAPAAALLAGLAFLFQPALVYHGSEPVFHYGLHQISLVLVPCFLVAFALLLAIGAAGGARWRVAYGALLGGLAVTAWVNASFFKASSGLLDGRSLLQLASEGEMIANTVFFVALTLALAALGWRFPAIARRLLLALFAVFAAQYAWIAAHSQHPWRVPPDTQRLFQLSSQRNVLVLLLDAFQSDFFTDILARDPALGSRFGGFTHFPQATGSAMTTYLAMPTIHSGAPVLDGKGIRGLYQREIVEGSFVAGLAARGYDAMMVNPILGRCPSGTRCEHSDAIVHGTLIPLVDGATFLFNISLFRMAPHLMKAGLYRGGRWWAPWRLLAEFAVTSNRLLDEMARQVRGGAAAPAVRFLHLFSTHGPASFDAGCRRVADPAWNRTSATAQDHCALRKVAALLDALRQRGLYDNTAIVIVADHGSGLPRDEASGFELGAGASPLLLVKPFAARGPLAASDRIVGVSDVAATVCAWTGDCRARQGADVLAASWQARPYPFVTYVWANEYYGADEVPFDNRYEVRGPPAAVRSWWRQTNLPARTRALEFAADDAAGTYGFGWSPLEQYEGRTIRWAVGPQTDFYIDLEPGDRALRMEVRTHDGNPGQEALIEIDGRAVGRIGVSTSWSVQEIAIPPDAITPGVERILVRPSKWSSPAPFDKRLLSVLFDRLEVVSGPVAAAAAAR